MTTMNLATELLMASTTTFSTRYYPPNDFYFYCAPIGIDRLPWRHHLVHPELCRRCAVRVGRFGWVVVCGRIDVWMFLMQPLSLHVACHSLSQNNNVDPYKIYTHTTVQFLNHGIAHAIQQEDREHSILPTAIPRLPTLYHWYVNNSINSYPTMMFIGNMPCFD